VAEALLSFADTALTCSFITHGKCPPTCPAWPIDMSLKHAEGDVEFVPEPWDDSLMIAQQFEEMKEGFPVMMSIAGSSLSDSETADSLDDDPQCRGPQAPWLDHDSDACGSIGSFAAEVGSDEENHQAIQQKYSHTCYCGSIFHRPGEWSCTSPMDGDL
jgi:hypothetical protein